MKKNTSILLLVLILLLPKVNSFAAEIIFNQERKKESSLNQYRFFKAEKTKYDDEKSLSQEVPPPSMLSDSNIKLSYSFDTTQAFCDENQHQKAASLFIPGANVDWNDKGATYEILFSPRMMNGVEVNTDQVLISGGDAEDVTNHKLVLNNRSLIWLIKDVDCALIQVQLNLEMPLEYEKWYYACARFQRVDGEKGHLSLILLNSASKLVGKAEEKIGKVAFLSPGEKAVKDTKLNGSLSILLGRSSTWVNPSIGAKWETFFGLIAYFRSTPEYLPDSDLFCRVKSAE